MYEKTPQLELTNGVKIYNDSFEYKKKRFFLPNIDRRNFFSALSVSEVFEDYIANDKIKNVANKVLYASAVVIPLITIILISKL